MRFRSLITVLLLVACCGLVQADPAPRILILLGDGEYHTSETLTAFTKEVLQPAGYQVDLVRASSDDRKSPDCHEFPGLRGALAKADLLFLSTRRRFPVEQDLAAIKKWVADGKPVIGIRTASRSPAATGHGRQGGQLHALYLNPDLDPAATVVLRGGVPSDPANTEPVAWTWIRPDKGRSFYTSMGGRDDFAQLWFRSLLLNAVSWSLGDR